MFKQNSRDTLPRPVGAGSAATAKPFDLVVANIGANTVIAMAGALCSLGSVVVLSGFFASRVEEVEAAYVERGAEPLSTNIDDEDGWAVLTLSADATEPSSDR